jgi:hypothetical protein
MVEKRESMVVVLIIEGASEDMFECSSQLQGNFVN